MKTTQTAPSGISLLRTGRAAFYIFALAGQGMISTPNRIFGIFFFQAEDGIRARTVTGVQTCALPISVREQIENTLRDAALARKDQPDPHVERAKHFIRRNAATLLKQGENRRDVPRSEIDFRSEERRVGKSGELGGGRIVKKKRKSEQ